MRNKIIISVIITILILSLLLFFAFSKKSDNRELEFVNITKGDIKIVVSCSGTIAAKKTVDVGTQVSGTIAKIYVDYNSKVKKGDIVAKLDSTLLEIAVKEAEADLVKAKSQYDYNLRVYENNQILHKEKLISDIDLESSKVTKDSSYAQYLTAEANLLKAKTNLNYSVIRSPIDGIVLEKSVEEGQTVAASLSSPTLFTIAQDLNDIQIEALIPESDIGKVNAFQRVVFTVDAYPDDTFEGVVKRVYLNPTVESNVVNYKAIIDAKNKNGKLLPGMTATVEIIVNEKNDIFMVKSSALKFMPDEATLKKFNFKREGDFLNNKNNKREKNSTANKEEKKFALIWYLEDSVLKAMPVTIGITDGQNTEIISDKIRDGLSIITGYKGLKKSSSSNNTNKSNSNLMNRMPPSPMF